MTKAEHNKLRKRVRLLKEMDRIMRNSNDENAFADWIELGIPDEPTEYDYIDIAVGDESYFETLEIFTGILTFYGIENFDGR